MQTANCKSALLLSYIWLRAENRCGIRLVVVVGNFQRATAAVLLRSWPASGDDDERASVLHRPTGSVGYWAFLLDRRFTGQLIGKNFWLVNLGKMWVTLRSVQRKNSKYYIRRLISKNKIHFSICSVVLDVSKQFRSVSLFKWFSDSGDFWQFYSIFTWFSLTGQIGFDWLSGKKIWPVFYRLTGSKYPTLPTGLQLQLQTRNRR